MVRALFIAVVALALTAAPAFANTCPALIAQLTDAVAKVDANDPKAAQVKGLITEAQKLHDAGKHDEAVAKAQEAAKLL